MRWLQSAFKFMSMLCSIPSPDLCGPECQTTAHWHSLKQLDLNATVIQDTHVVSLATGWGCGRRGRRGWRPVLNISVQPTVLLFLHFKSSKYPFSCSSSSSDWANGAQRTSPPNQICSFQSSIVRRAHRSQVKAGGGPLALWTYGCVGQNACVSPQPRLASSSKAKQ